MSTFVRSVSVFRAVLEKELRDNARDRRALQTALLITPLMGPVMMVLMFNLMSDVVETAKAPKLPVAGAEHAPMLIEHLKQRGVTVVDAPADPVAAVRAQDVDVVLRIPTSFGADLRAGKPARLELITDTTRNTAQATVGHVESIIQGYGSTIGSMRLVARGIDPALTTAIAVDTHDVSTEQARGTMILGMLPLMLLLACFIGGMYVAIDATAGERERGSLEPLLNLPLRSIELIAAKVAATAVFALLSAAASVLAFYVAIPFIPLDTIGVSVHLSGTLALRLLTLLMPTAVLGAALLVLIGVLSKTFRTAQASISLVSIGPMIPGLITSIFPQKPELPMVLVPALGESILASQLLRGESVSLLHQAALAATDVGVAAIIIVVAARLFGPRLLT